ncbi:MAG: quinolinate synthase NadA [bacterium]
MNALIDEVRRLKAETGALVLCHNYQRPEVYDAADFIGDSLELARQAQGTDAEFIVFCGVRFMAETAKLLNPGARVVLAEPRAGCQMADMISAEALRLRREELAPVQVVAYVNTPVEVKAESDICCTSANAVAVVQSLGPGPVLFVPDRNLAAYVARLTGREIIPWEGFCYVHATFTVADVARARSEHPQARVIAHPECPLDVIDAADDVASTSGMARLAGTVPEVVLATEVGMCERIRRLHPASRCWPLRRSAVCRNMKLTRLEAVRAALAGTGGEEIAVSPGVAERARRALERMTQLG